MSNELNRANFLDEARRQSILASNSPKEDEDVWLENADTTDGGESLPYGHGSVTC